MSSEAGFGAAAVRYASVGAGFRGPSGPPTVGEPATDGRGPAHGRARSSPRTTAEKATHGAGGSGHTDRPPGFFPLTWHFGMPEHYRRLPRHRTWARLSVGTPGRQCRTAVSLPSVA